MSENWKADVLNATNGTLHLEDGYECEKCRNKGIIYKMTDEGEIRSVKCECLTTRRSIKLLQESGLQLFVQNNSIDDYETTHEWQKNLKEKTQNFMAQDKIKWYFIGGQVGIGKTFLCTTICRHFIEKGVPTRYMLWTEISKRLKANINEDTYFDIIEPFKKIDVLYIDDFLKVKKGQMPTPADMNIAFDILNSRLFDQNKVTIISSEFTIRQLLPLDEATISRIIEKSGEFLINIDADMSKNYRLKGAK